MADLLVVHLVSRGVAGIRSGWDAPDGTVRHEVVSWRQSPSTLSRADVVVAHGLAPLVVAQAIVGTGPKLVYRPSGASRATRRRLRSGLKADWVAATNRRSGRADASALGLPRHRITVFRNDERAAWDRLVSAMLRQDGDVGRASSKRHEPGATLPPGPLDVAPGAAKALSATDTSPAMDAPERGRSSFGTPRVVVPPLEQGALSGREAAGSSLTAPAAAEIPAAPMLAVGVVNPSSPGHLWWQYRRLELPPRPGVPDAAASTGGFVNGARANGSRANGSASNGTRENRPRIDGVPGGDARDGGEDGAGNDAVQIVSATVRNGVAFFALGSAIAIVIAVCTQLGTVGEGPYLVPLGGFFLTLAAARRIVRRRPDEDWVSRWMVYGFGAKLLAAYLNYHTVVVHYNGKGDALDYDGYGRQYAHAWLKGGAAPNLPNLKATNFLRWFTGVVYYIFGSNLLAGTFVFALLAFAGSYLWYRATVDAIPLVNRRLYLGFVLFAPSILYWPAIVGKEALMQFALGVLALGVSLIVRQRLIPGLVVSGASGWLVWVVRPHLLALVAVAAGAAYLAGRVRKAGKKKAGLLGRPIGIIIIALLVAFTIGQGAQFLGIKSLSFNSIQQELDTESSNTSIGNSTFHKSTNSLSPVKWPSDAVTVFLRPFPWEIQSGLQILASLESALLALLIVVRLKSLRLAFSRSRESPFLMFCWVLTGLYAIAFSSFSNFGLLVRERSLVLPAMLVLLSVDPALDRLRRREPGPGPGEASGESGENSFDLAVPGPFRGS